MKSPGNADESFFDDVIKSYPSKVGRKRTKHIVLNDPSDIPEIEANVRTIPGIITQRGCCYAGCKGVVLGPIIDMVHITHGPIGCAYYSWGTRRNLGRTGTEAPNYLQYSFSTDLQEEEIVFGGEKKLRAAVREAFEIFHPKAIAIFSTCPVGLIGDDINAVAREMKAELGINIFAFNCEGYRGVSQSAGHHIANNGLFKNVIGLDDTPVEGEFTMNILGEYNIGGDSWEIHRILEKCGITPVATLSGDVTYGEIARAHTARLNAVMCHRSINYLADMMEVKFGIPWLKVNFIGADATAKSLRKIAKYFDDPGLTDRIEEVICEELSEIAAVREDVAERCKGKTAMLFVGGSRAHHYQELFKDIGIRTIAAGYEFAHRDDYEGRQVIPGIKIDADSRNIEELHVDIDPERYRSRKSPEELDALKEHGLQMADYHGMMAEMEKGTLVIDDISHHEMERLIDLYNPSIFCSGVKDKFVLEKMGIPCKQLHSYDYGGPYAGFQGAANFYREIDRMLNNWVWSMVEPPWVRNSEIQAQLCKR